LGYYAASSGKLVRNYNWMCNNSGEHSSHLGSSGSSSSLKSSKRAASDLLNVRSQEILHIMVSVPANIQPNPNTVPPSLGTHEVSEQKCQIMQYFDLVLPWTY